MADAVTSLSELEQQDEFLRRHIGPDEAQVAEMLGYLKIESLQSLIEKAVPDSIRNDGPLAMNQSRSETAILARIREIADKNKVYKSMIGMGYHNTHTPTVILRNILENPAWYTAYTPYQAEISQGRLEAILNFQTMIADLTGMELANSSLLDEGTAAAEAMTLCQRVGKSKSNRFLVDSDCHPQTIDVLRTRSSALDIEVVVGDPRGADRDAEVFAVLLQYPGSSGEIRDDRDVMAEFQSRGAMVAVSADLLSLTLLTPPGELGADVVVGTSQRFGVPLGFGGPHAGYMAVRDKHKRSVPGRLVGVSVDSSGRPALRLALQTREQHIRREKATSNICTAQVLLAVIASMYAVYHGPQGLKIIAKRVHRLTAILAEGLRQGGVDVETKHFFDTITLKVPGRAAEVAGKARQNQVNLREVDGDTLGIALDETTTAADVELLWKIFGAEGLSVAQLDGQTADALPQTLLRSSDILTHEVFNRYHAETEMLRYLRKLADKDIALDRAMIPLGSCTMKLNATTEMIPITWPEFGAIHPFVPMDQAEGYLELIKELEDMLAEITGYDAVSLQPNAGSQGEYAGLLAIKKYHESRGDHQRDICLIPSSAHGTNPASAAMAGMKVVVTNCDSDGNVDVDDLRVRAEEYSDRLAALMVTYPSTHGVFEARITEICEIIHDHGGQVYMDGANLNAMVGVAKPGRFGSDVSHLNLHKTFCIPHGGGGPGVGPIGVGAHLAPFLPNHSLVAEAGPESGVGAVSSAPWGSAGILPISWAYIALMGADGLRRATEVAILSANYIARRLEQAFPVLYTGANGMIAHECIIDLRPIKDQTGVTVDDVAKRLIDYGFHAPTMSFPVAGTLMIEPTESESKQELDRFCDAMLAIRAEIAEIESGKTSHDDSPLAHAPHTAEDLVSDQWNRAYSREAAVYPVESLRAAKYWPPVGRVDNVYGDRNLACSCPSIESYRDAAE
ncbi:aminomethyl-transferring glycine dehydrogenase [Denitrobaculum tricleocarpae]|uniref:Glycine dehydrogenase (decarboxylating) n=1 Tax=Denitrobaculum tricleocarpae TaxID=2591009 RepID=A0A545U256_9PROT|nr:aminomethyl-transferring glycine dehydrogenase [Denitrobaculum tricleocarpae]TQV83483.1 aminomethyl-transferring glycine dehydrogenase [Denitrobaculum tricleocarpae]